MHTSFFRRTATYRRRYVFSCISGRVHVLFDFFFPLKLREYLLIQTIDGAATDATAAVLLNLHSMRAEPQTYIKKMKTSCHLLEICHHCKQACRRSRGLGWIWLISYWTVRRQHRTILHRKVGDCLLPGQVVEHDCSVRRYQ